MRGTIDWCWRHLALCLVALAVLLFAVAIGGGLPSAAGQAPTAVSIELDGSIDPATEDWIGSALEDAVDDGAVLAIIALDTPGGLDTSMRAIVQDIIDTPIPVVVYVSPDGARAASAGVFITEAADVAAMAPQTNIGSASPISIDGSDLDEVLGRKIENDAAAYVRALADVHGRNPELAEQMVREATNVDAKEALASDLIDLIATDEQDLIAQLDGFEVQGPKAQVLDTTGVEVEQREMPLSYELLQIIVNPNVAYLLLLVGIVGLVIELFSPGAILPGALGLVSLVLGLYGSSQLPVTVAGVLLLVTGVGLIIAEAHLPTGGVLGVIGVIALAAAGLLLYDTGSEGLGASPPLVISVALIFGALLAVVVSKVLKARHRPVKAGYEELVGMPAEVRVELAGRSGQVFVHGALWQAELAGGPQAPVIARGARVRVEAVDGLTLIVSPTADDDGGDQPQGGS